MPNWTTIIVTAHTLITYPSTYEPNPITLRLSPMTRMSKSCALITSTCAATWERSRSFFELQRLPTSLRSPTTAGRQGGKQARG